MLAVERPAITWLRLTPAGIACPKAATYPWNRAALTSRRGQPSQDLVLMAVATGWEAAAVEANRPWPRPCTFRDCVMEGPATGQYQ